MSSPLWLNVLNPGSLLSVFSWLAVAVVFFAEAGLPWTVAVRA